MGNKSTKPELTADEQWLEKKCPGAGQISANRWRNPKKTNCTAWEGNCSPGQIQQLSKCLHAEIEKTSGKKKVLRMYEYVSFFVPWQEESKKREEKRNKKQNKQSKKSPTETTNPPPYQPPPSTPGPPDTEQPYPPNPYPPVSKNPFVKPQDPYVSARQQLNLMTREDPPPWPPGPLGQFPLIQATNPNYERIRTTLAPRPDYEKIGETKQKENESASDFLDRLRPVFRQNSDLEYDEGVNTPFEQQLKNAFLKGLLPKVRAHVDKHWVTQNTGSLADALQHAEHAVKVQKNKTALPDYEKPFHLHVDGSSGYMKAVSTPAEWMTKLLENKEIVLSNQLPRDSLPVSSRSCSQHPQHARLLNDPRGFIKATQRRLSQSKTHQHLLKVSDKFRLWSSPTSSVRSVGGRVISGNTRDPTPLAEVYSLEATGVSGGREEENTHRNGDARQRTQDSTEGERRDGHRRRQYWTTGCQLTTVTTLCFMFVFSVFLTIAIVSMNMTCTDNPCDPHCQQIYRQYPSVTCSEQSAVPKQDHRTTEKVELTRKKRSFCRGYCYGVAGARKYDNPCNQTATLKKTEDLYLCYYKTSFSSAVWIPLNSFHIGGRRGDKWNEYDWYLSSTDWDRG